jgi:hypothetical protein
MIPQNRSQKIKIVLKEQASVQTREKRMAHDLPSRTGGDPWPPTKLTGHSTACVQSERRKHLAFGLRCCWLSLVVVTSTSRRFGRVRYPWLSWYRLE